MGSWDVEDTASIGEDGRGAKTWRRIRSQLRQEVESLPNQLCVCRRGYANNERGPNITNAPKEFSGPRCG